jgi:hypothetical protein
MMCIVKKRIETHRGVQFTASIGENNFPIGFCRACVNYYEHDIVGFFT